MAIPLSNPSSVTVSTLNDLANNFAENSASTLCQAALGAGGYAIGSKLLGFKPIPPQAALATTAAFLAAALLCPANLQPNDIFGEPPQFEGGQCSVVYLFECDLTMNGSPLLSQTGFFRGPCDRVVAPFTEGTGASGGAFYRGQPIQGGFLTVYGLLGQPYVITSGPNNVRRQDGGADNCGSAPGTPGQLIVNNIEGDTFDVETITDNSNNVYIAPVIFNVGGQQFSLNMTFGDIQIESLLPLNYTVNISGTVFGFGQDDDGVLKPRPVSPNPESQTDTDEQLRKVIELLEGIQTCVCDGDSPGEIVTAFIPFVPASSESCDAEVIPLRVVSEDYTVEKATLLNESAALARIGCESLQVPEQLPESFLFAATTTVDGREIFTGNIPPEVRSVRIKITAIGDLGPQKITVFPEANQRKFGSVAFVSSEISGGGDYLYVFDEDTYMQLPERGKPGRLRILFRRQISFEIYDTGERF